EKTLVGSGSSTSSAGGAHPSRDSASPTSNRSESVRSSATSDVISSNTSGKGLPTPSSSLTDSSPNRDSADRRSWEEVAARGAGWGSDTPTSTGTSETSTSTGTSETSSSTGPAARAPWSCRSGT